MFGIKKFHDIGQKHPAGPVVGADDRYGSIVQSDTQYRKDDAPCFTVWISPGDACESISLHVGKDVAVIAGFESKSRL